MTDDNEVMTGGAEFTAEEQAYFDNRGAIPAQEPKQEAEPAAEPEKDASEALKEAVEEGERQKQVPHQALHEERKRRKDAEERARSLELENAKAIARLEALLEANKPKEEAPPEPPKRLRAYEDVFGTSDKAYEMAETALERLERLDKERKAEAETRELTTRITRSVQTFKEQTPDYNDAYKYAVEMRAAELENVWGVPADKIPQVLEREQLQFARDAMARGRDPAKAFYDAAVYRGYQKKAAPAADTGESDAVKKLETVAAGQKAGQSLSGTGGGAPTGGLSAKDILSMSDEDFLAFEANSKNAAKVRRLMGGR